MAILYFLLFLGVAIETTKNIYYNYFGKNLIETNKDTLFFNVIGCLGTIAFFAAAILMYLRRMIKTRIKIRIRIKVRILVKPLLKVIIRILRKVKVVKSPPPKNN